jgi:hypothetical protein
VSSICPTGRWTKRNATCRRRGNIGISPNSATRRGTRKAGNCRPWSLIRYCLDASVSHSAILRRSKNAQGHWGVFGYLSRKNIPETALDDWFGLKAKLTPNFT